MNLRMKRPSPAFVVAMVALFVALGGTAGAVVTAAVPLAKRALVADNAKKVGGLTAELAGPQFGGAQGVAAGTGEHGGRPGGSRHRSRSRQWPGRVPACVTTSPVAAITAESANAAGCGFLSTPVRRPME